MTAIHSTGPNNVRKPSGKAGTLLGVCLGVLAAFGSVHAAPAPAGIGQAALPSSDPAKAMPAQVQVANIDFKRGDGGAGRLVLRFSGEGAAPDLRTMGSNVVIDVGNAALPPALRKSLNVTDFATPVQRVDATSQGDGTQIVLGVQGGFESMAYQTGSDYVVEILPRVAAESADRAVGAPQTTRRTGGTASASATPARYSGRPISFNFQDVPVRTVLQLIAEDANLNIVVSDTVQGNITLRLVNVPLDQALDIVLQSKGLDKRRNGNVVWVAPQAEIAKFEQDKEDARLNLENREEMVTEYIPINYANAEDIAKMLTENAKSGAPGGAGAGAGAQRTGFLSARGSIGFDSRTNTLLVVDIPSRVAAIKHLINELDKPVDQVVIEGRIVIANESFARELGAKFGVSGNSGNVYYSNSISNNKANQDADVTARQNYRTAYNDWLNANPPATRYDPVTNPGGVRPPVPGLSSLTRGLMSNFPAASSAGALALSILNAGYGLDVELSALQEEGRGEVISNPRVVTSNQKEAVIKQGEEVGYLTVMPGAAGGAAMPQVNFKEAVLELKVTPTITNDGRVFLTMNVKKDEVAGYINTGVGQVPRIAKREVTTAVLIEDGQTVVVGGVYEFKNAQDVSKVPFLADLPVIGNLFKKRVGSRSKAELLIFMTPRIVRVAQRRVN